MQPIIKYGEHTYGIPRINGEGTLNVGKFCSIAEDVKIVLWGHHTNRFTTYPFGHTSSTLDCQKYCPKFEHPIRGEVIIGNDVWIGDGARICYGVKIGDGAIIASGAHVTKNVKPYTVVGGNPAEFLYSRFDKKIVDLLLKLKWWDLPYETIIENSHILTSNNYDELLEFYNKTRSKKIKKIYVVSPCYNEEKILPFYLDYYTNFIKADKIILYDGGSTDNTQNIANSYPNVEFIVQDVGKMDERNLRDIRNDGWKKYKNDCDWVIICDMDEFIYHPNLKNLLEKYDNEGVTIPKVNGYDMISKDFPSFKKGKYLPSFIQNGVYEPVWLNKSAIFKPLNIDINYNFGTHNCSPIGEVKYSENTDIKLLQYKWLSHEYVTDKSLKSSQRLSEWNLETGMASHYKEYAKMTENDFNNKLSSSKKIVSDFPEKELTVFWHCYLINNWYEIMEEQMKLIIESGLYEKLKPYSIHLCYYGDEEQSVKMNDFISKHDPENKVIIHYIDKNFYEYPTLQRLHEFAYENDSYILYLHLKGVWSYTDTSKNSEAIRSWRKCLEYFNIEKWSDCVDKLNEGYEVVGALYNYNEKEPLFSGNIWWTTSDYVRKLKYPDYDETQNPYLGKPEDDGTWCRVECEKWINTIPNNFYNFYVPKDYGFYFIPIDEKDYRKELTELMDKYRMFFIQDDCGGVNRLFGLKDLIVENVNKKDIICEIGCFEGISSELFSMYCKELYCVDYWNVKEDVNIPIAEEIFDKMIQKHRNIKKIKKSSEEAVKDFEDGFFDLVYIDASHEYEEVKKDILNWSPKIKKGGILSGHDYNIDFVKKAVDDFFPESSIKVYSDSSWCVKIGLDKNKRLNDLLEKPRMFFNENPDGNINTLHGLKDLIEKNTTQNSIVCEIGSFAGVSSELFSLYCKEIHCVDSWEKFDEIWWMTDYIEQAEKLFDNVMNRSSNIRKIKKTSEEASKDYPDEYFDLVYIDGAHDYDNVKKDILNWLPKVKENGVISGHDYYAFQSNTDTDVKKILDELFKGIDVKIYSDSSWSVKKSDIRKKIALVCIAKDEDYYLDEWLEYNHKLGFDHIFLYENNWRCNIEKPYLTKIDWPGDVQQLPAYNNFIQNYKNEYDYAAFFDCDEFLVLKKHKNIHEFVNEYGNKNIAINWQKYGSGDKLYRENNSLLKQFTKRQHGVDVHIKSILYLKIDSRMELPHDPDTHTYDTNRKMIIGAFNPNGPDNIVVLNHYQDKTKEDYELKIKRGYSDTLDRPIIIEDWINRKNDDIEVEDLTACNFLYGDYKISVIIPTYNRLDSLTDCIESVVKQNYKNLEILVCHDGPSEMFESFKFDDDRISYYTTDRQNNNLGASQRNMMIPKITGDYVLFLDDDNILYENYLQKMTEQITLDTGMVVCRIHFNDKKWQDLILPRKDELVPCEIDHLSILFKTEIAKNFIWDNDWGQDHRFIKACEKLSIEKGFKIKYIHDILANHKYLGDKEERPVVVFNHNYLIGKWENVVREQLTMLKSSGLYDKCLSIHSYVTFQYEHNTSKQDKFEELIKEFDTQKKIKVVWNQKNNFEFNCLQGISKFSEGNPSDICYYHTKGVYSETIKENIGVKSWRDYLNYFTITKWRDSVDKLKEFDVVGVNYDFNDIHNDYVIGGNFFWTKSEYVKTLPFPEVNPDRFSAERWILRNKDRKVHELFNTGKLGYKNLYMEYLNPIKYKSVELEEIINKSYERYGTQQNKWEYNEFFQRLIKGKTESVLEIGAKFGGTTYGFCNIFEKVVSIDIFKEEQLTELEKMYNNLTFILGDSHSPTTKNQLKGMKFDVVFIDGDHHYEAVKQDYLDYKEFVKDDGVIVFHDIKQTWWTDSIEIQVPILWNEIKYDYRYEEIINNENDCFGIGLLYKKEEQKPEREKKTVVVMTSHPNYKMSEDITKLAIDSFGDRDIILSAHCPVSVDIQNKITYFVYDKNNPLIRHDYYNQSWFETDEYYSLIKLHYNDNDLQHALAVYINYYNSIMYAKSLGYTTAICTNFDLIFSKKDLNIIDNKIHKMDITGKKSFFMTSSANEGIHYKTIFFITDVDFFLEKFKYVVNETDYNKLTREVGSETNCLENFFYETLKNSDELMLEEIHEKEFFSTSTIDMFSNIEYFTVLPLRGDNEHFVIWYSSANSIDNRNVGIDVLKDGESIFTFSQNIGKDYRFYKEIKFEKGSNYEVIRGVYYDDVVNKKTIIVNDDVMTNKIKDYGDFWKKV